MPCVCRKTITPTQPKPASLNSYTLRSFVINMRKETAPGGQVPTGTLVASVGSHPREQTLSWQVGEKHIALFTSEGRGALCCLQAPVISLVSRKLGQPAPIFYLLLPGPECVAVCPPASGGSGVPTGHLGSWPQCMNVREEFPLNIYYPWYHSQQLAGQLSKFTWTLYFPGLIFLRKAINQWQEKYSPGRNWVAPWLNQHWLMPVGNLSLHFFGIHFWKA